MTVADKSVTGKQSEIKHEMDRLAKKPRIHEQTHFTNLEELQDLAEPILPRMIHRYYAGATEGEVTLRDNRAVWTRYRLLPTMMRDVSKMDISTTLLGDKLAFPVGIAPMSMQRMAHPEGELAVASAAAEAGIPMIVSTMGTTRLDDVCQAAAGAPAMMFQLYVFTRRENTVRLIKEAEAAGYKALCFTVDVPALSNREDDTRNNFKLPDHLHLENLPEIEQADKELKASGKGDNLSQMGEWHDGSLTWDFVAWIRTQTSLPIFVKGILSPADAEKAVENGCDGIIVSNHGGRQLDYTPASLDMLPAIAEAVNRRVPIWLDGGVRRGTDIIKALALGADGVLVGRPIIFALALGGKDAITRALGILKKEFELSLALMGCSSIRDLRRSHVILPRQLPARL